MEMSEAENDRIATLRKLGGPIRISEMDEKPTFDQWVRYFLYRVEFDAAMLNAARFFVESVSKPADFDDDRIAGYGIPR